MQTKTLTQNKASKRKPRNSAKELLKAVTQTRLIFVQNMQCPRLPAVKAKAGVLTVSPARWGQVSHEIVLV